MTTPSLRSDRAALAREVVHLAWPAIVQGLLTTVVLFTDRLLLGRYAADALGSMNISGPLIWSVFSVFGAIGAGIIAVVGRAVGARDTDRARRAVAASLAFSFGLGIVVMIGGIALRDVFTVVIAGGGPETADVRALARTYMGVVFLAAPLQTVGASAMVALQAGGDTKTPMRVSVASGLLNLVLSYVLLFGAFGFPELGIAGSAVGSVGAFSLYALVLLWLLVKRDHPVALRRPDGPMLPVLAPILRISLPTLGEKLVFHTGYVAFSAIIGRLGEVAMTAHQSLIAIESLGFIAASGFGVASGALVAQKLGAEREEDAVTVGWLSAGVGVVALSAVGLVFLIFPERLVGLFTTDPEVIALGARCLRVAAIAQPLMALTDALAGALRGAGDTKSPMRVALLGPVFVRLIACYVLAFPMGLGLLGIWLGTTLDWLVRGAVLAVLWARGRWRQVARRVG